MRSLAPEPWTCTDSYILTPYYTIMPLHSRYFWIQYTSTHFNTHLLMSFGLTSVLTQTPNVTGHTLRWRDLCVRRAQRRPAIDFDRLAMSRGSRRSGWNSRRKHGFITVSSFTSRLWLLFSKAQPLPVQICPAWNSNPIGWPHRTKLSMLSPKSISQHGKITISCEIWFLRSLYMFCNMLHITSFLLHASTAIQNASAETTFFGYLCLKADLTVAVQRNLGLLPQKRYRMVRYTQRLVS